MTTDSSHLDGTVSDEEIAYLERRCRTGFAAGITSCAYVHESGRAWRGLGALTSAHLASLTRVASALRSGGGFALLQLYDGGRIADPAIVGAAAIRAPSSIASLRPGALTPRAMRPEEVDQLIDAFGRSAGLARDAGFDGIEIHGANHYLIHQFFSPRSNHRDDHWGGSLEKRMRFPLAVARAVRDATGNKMIVGFRLNPLEREAGGFTLDDSSTLADHLGDLDLDYVHVSMDNYRISSPQPEDRDWSKHHAAIRGRNPITALSEVIAGRCAVVASGGIRTLDDAHEAIAAGADLVAIARAVLVEPEWLDKIQRGEHDRVRRALPPDVHRITAELTIPERMATYLLSRPGWVPTERDGTGPDERGSGDDHTLPDLEPAEQGGTE